ncbi:MAG: enoyl-CoA hydratase/isomerase family protein, partial [Phaeodactylibacter sp.]|nr:enoyl-CoA hydratase/isomerase family protein [Phaeodactylibacter sp.]
MQDNNTILYELDGHVARITLNRPRVYNSFNREMALALQACLDQCRDAPEVRAVYLSGAGKAFSAGQDLQEVIAEDGPEMTTILTEHYNPIIRRIRQLEKPVVAAVNGVAAGAGANIALACDIVVAAESASFIQAFSKIGLIPDSGGTFFLPRLIGFQKASALMMLGEKVGAREAERLGMIYAYYDDEHFEEKSMAIARTLSLMPTKGLGYTKQALNQSMENGLERQLALEDQLQTAAGQTEDYREG